MKKLLSFLIVVIMLCASSSAFAAGTGPRGEPAAEPVYSSPSEPDNIPDDTIVHNLNDPFDYYPSPYASLTPSCEPLEPTESEIELINHHELHEDLTKGDSKPTETTKLPFTASATIASSVYTNKMFMPNSSGEFYTKLTGTIFSVPRDETVTLTLYDNITGKVAVSYEISKTNPITLNYFDFTLQCRETNSF